MSWTLTSTTSSTSVSVLPEWEDISFRRDREEGRFRPLGRTHDVFVTGVRRGQEIVIAFLTIGEADWFALDSMLARTETLQLSDGSRSWFVRVLYPIETTLLPTGDQRTRPIRRTQVTFVEQAAP